MINVLAAVAGIKLDSNAGGLHRHGWKRDGIDMDAFFANCPSKVLRLRLVTEPDRNDRCLRRYELVIQLVHHLDEIALVVPYPPAALPPVPHALVGSPYH